MSRRAACLAGIAVVASGLVAPSRTAQPLTALQEHARSYQIIAAPACEELARRIEASQPRRFTFHESTWDKFPDGTDRIVVGSVESTTVWPSRNSKATIVWPGPEK
mmetsp:Transcript_17272/g.53935  ORF Transcript_17272/g.53935 Transcript_17272/m.53935 type:complete len:106 (-) Transcript_17272:26-343(-)